MQLHRVSTGEYECLVMAHTVMDASAKFIRTIFHEAKTNQLELGIIIRVNDGTTDWCVLTERAIKHAEMLYRRPIK